MLAQAKGCSARPSSPNPKLSATTQTLTWELDFIRIELSSAFPESKAFPITRLVSLVILGSPVDP